MSKNTEYTEVYYDAIKHNTGIALLFDIDDEDCWVPLSVIENAESLDVDGGNAQIAEWFADKAGLI